MAPINNTQGPIFQNPNQVKMQAPQGQGQGPNDPNDNYDNRKEFNEKDFSWLDLGKGLAGAVAGAATTGVLMTGSSLVRAPQAVGEAYKTIYKTKAIGPVLKATLYPVVTVAGLATPVLTAVGSTLYGLVTGFMHGAEENPIASVKHGVKDAKTFHNDLAGKLLETIREGATIELEEGQKPYDIRVIEGLKGLAGGAVAGVVDGVGVGAVTLVNTPEALYRLNKAAWTSEASLPLKVGATLVSIPAAPLAVGLATVGGALYGLGIGAKDGYTQGVGHAAKEAVSTVKKYHETVREGLDNVD